MMRLVFLAILVALATSQCTEPSPYYQIDFFNIKSFRNANETDTGAQKGTAFVDTTQRHIFYNFSVAGFSPDEVAASAWFFMAEEGSPGDTMACIPLAPGRCFCGIFPTMWYQPIVPKYAKRIDKRSVGDSFCWAYQYTNVMYGGKFDAEVVATDKCVPTTLKLLVHRDDPTDVWGGALETFSNFAPLPKWQIDQIMTLPPECKLPPEGSKTIFPRDLKIPMFF